MGIPDEERVRIFDRGARLDTGKPGTGLGLAIVRDVAEIYGGGSVFVTVDAEPDDKDCIVWVEDDGMGIAPDQRAALFERGARLDTGKPGTGLGLAIVRDVAEIYGGGVTLGESEDLGGLLVRLILPRAG
jgi:signal transduction histidine kinase